MCKRNCFIWIFLSCVVILLIELPPTEASSNRDQPWLRAVDDGTLLIEAAQDRNITLRLMGDAASLLLNEVDIVALLQRRRRAATAQSTAAQREPLSLDALKEEFRGVQRDLNRLARWLSNMHNGTRRSGLSQRVLRRTLQRVQVVGNTLTTLESNLRVNECASNPCKNGGTCHDAYKSFQCICPKNWQGATCEDDVNECFDLASTDLDVCMNDAQCINTPGSYRCVCRTGYSGVHCRLHHNACLSNQSAELCGSHGTCLSASNAAGYVCICDQGWTWADANVTQASASPCTRDVDECAPEINPCHDECINLPGSFRCAACPPGYTGDGKYCRDIDECRDGNNGGCSQRPTVSCINTEGSFRCGRCPIGWTGDGRSCSPTKSNSCDGEQICNDHAKCEYISETVVCSCRIGYYGHGYGADGCTEDSDRKPCDNHPCQNNGTCVLNGRGTSCICQPGYKGALCTESDACHPNPCHNGGTCRLLPRNEFMCVCQAGYSGSSCSHLRSFCGISLRNETGSVRFPPSEGSTQLAYEPNERCPFIIATRRGMILNVTFTFFDLENSTDCTADFLQLHDGTSLTARLIGRFCGQQLPLGNGTVITTQPQLFLWFLSNNATQGHGFNLTWSSMPMTCGAELDLEMGQTGVLRSPGYPGKAQRGIDCRWKLSAPFGTRFLLHFYEITLGPSESRTPQSSKCSEGDYLNIYETNRQLYRACQSAEPAPLYSSVNLLSLHFHTDLVRMDSSFQVHYEVIAGHPNCGGIFTEASGLIIGHMNAPICLFLVQQPKDTRIQLIFEELDFMGSPGCQLQSVEIFDGSSVDQPLIGRFCNMTQANQQLLLSSRNLILLRYQYQLAGLELPRNFKVRYSRECGDNIISNSGDFSTPNYPNGYLEDLDCVYNINIPAQYKIRLTIIDLSISGEERISTAQQDDDASVNVGVQPNYLDVYFSRNASDKQRFSRNLTNHVLVSKNNRMKLYFRGASNPQHARGLRFQFESFLAECGGVFTSPQASYRRFVQNSDCEWTIEVPGRKLLHVDMYNPIRKGKLQIFDNSTVGQGKLLRNYDGGDRRFEMNEEIDSNLLTIKVYGKETFSRVIIDYQPANTMCGGTYSARYGTIKSPNWPDNYGSSENCTWIIRVPFGERLELIVHNFTTESTSDRCTDDYVEIRNGDHSEAPLIGRYCGFDIPPRLPSYANALYIHFHSDALMEESGFHFNWQITTVGCGGKLTSSSGSIHSPHSMSGNRGALACDWQISVSAGSTVDLQLQSRDDLCNGLLSLYDGPTVGSPKLPLNCSIVGEKLALRSRGNQVLVRYNVNDESPEGMHFLLDYTTNCIVRLEQLSGAIETPNFPDKYDTNTKCEWDIRAGEAKSHVQLAISHMSFEAVDPDCAFDYVLLRDYRNTQLVSERRLCTATQDVVTSVGNRLVLQFNSDTSIGSQGFHAEFKRVGCGEELRAASGKIETPNAPFSVDEDCQWHILVSEGYQIELSIEELHIETPQHDCSQDTLTVWSGSNASDVMLRSCQVEFTAQKFSSPANELHIRFRSSTQRTRKYMKATYTQVPARCGGTISASSGLIASPSYYQQGLDVYDKDIECVWVVEVEHPYTIQFSFDVFNFTTNSELSSLTIYGSKHLKKGDLIKPANFSIQYSGNEPSEPLTMEGTVHVTFKAKKGAWGKFAMRFQRGCGGKRIDHEGYLNSRLDTNCIWEIQSENGTRITLNINQLECPCTSQGGNCTTGLWIYNDEDDVLYYNLCKEHPSSLVIPTNVARIEAVGIVLAAQYSTLDNSCGGTIKSARGTLNSPNYPDSYPSNVECEWQTNLRPGNAIELRFEAMDIFKSEHCNFDFLEVRAGKTGSLLGLYCDNVLPVEPLTVSSDVWVKFRSQSGSTGKGFKLRWNYAHVNEFSNITSGKIESPPTLAVRGDEQPYIWRIFAELDSIIVIDFKEYNTGLQLFDGFDDTGLRIPIQNSPWQFTSSSNIIYLKTVNADFDAFLLNWHIQRTDQLTGNVTLTEGCGMSHLVGREATIHVKSPGYPHGYRPRLNCEWVFKAQDDDRHVVAKLYDASLEVSDKCALDYLSIQTSSNMVDWQEQLHVCNMSATRWPSLLKRVEGTPYLKIKFVSDVSMNGTGFRAGVETNCGGNMTGKVGTITIPKKERWWDQNMQDSSVCEYHINVRPGSVVDISIEYHSEAVNNTCTHYGLIYDGVDTGAPMLPHGKFCNQLNFNTKSYRTSGPHATIKYLMFEKWNNRMGTRHVQNNWTLTYREYNDCQSEIRLTHLSPSYVLSTPKYPDYPPAYSDCTWLIVAPLGETVSATFVNTFDLSVQNCDKEFAELYDGSTMLSRRLLRTCHKPATTRSSGNMLLVHYQSELNEPHAGFSLNVSVSQCGGEHTSPSGVISSVNYPLLGGYPKPAECEYTVKTRSDTHIVVNITDLNVPYDVAANANDLDRLEFLDMVDERRVLLILYGNLTELPYSIPFSTNELAVRFVTKNPKLNTYRGFRLQYNKVDGACDQAVNAVSGELKLSRNLIPKKFQRFCKWRITVPKGQRVRFEFLNLDELRSDLPKPNTRISRIPGLDVNAYNDMSFLSKIVSFNFDAYNGSGVIESTDNLMYVRVLLRPSMPQKPVLARFTSLEASSCPPDIGKQAVGTLSNAEMMQLPRYYCHMHFLAEPQVTISFNVTYSRTKPGGLVRFYDEVLKTLKVLPPGNAIFSMATTTGRVEIIQNEPVTGFNFRATYRRYACGGDISLMEGTTMQLPLLREHFGVLECVWTLNNAYLYRLQVNASSFSFADRCENEYVSISARLGGDELTRFCRDTILVSKSMVPLRIGYVMRYHATQYQAGSSEFQLIATNLKDWSLGVGNLMLVGDRPIPLVTVGPSDYKNNIELFWEYKAPSDLTLRLEFRDRFFIEMAPNCSNDRLEVLDYRADLWQTIATLCGRELPAPLNTQSNRLRLIFRTNGNITADGFTFNVSTTCDMKLQASSELQTVNGGHFHRSIYKKSVSCNYEFVTDTKHQLVVIVKPKSDRAWLRGSCRYSYFDAYRIVEGKEQTINQTMCPSFEVNGYERLRLVFKTISSLTHPFELQYQLVGCGGNYTAPFTLRPLLSDLGTTYKSRQECEWHVLAPPQHAIFLRFKYFELENRCQYDDLSIYRGSSHSKEQLISKLCGNLTSPSVMVDSNEALIVATLPRYMDESGRGFVASVHFTPNCNERLALSEGNTRLDLVRSYQLNASTAGDELHCYFRVSVPLGNRVSVWLKQLQLNELACPKCSSLEILDGFDGNSASLGSYFAHLGNGSKLYSSYNEVLIKLSAIAPSKNISFELLLEMEATVCGQLDYTLDKESINLRLSSKNVSSTFQGNVDCNWHITTVSDIQIDAHDVQLADISPLTRKCVDYVFIKADYFNRYYCGKFSNTTWDLPYIRSFNVIFRRSGSDSSYELNLTIRPKKNCNRTLTALDGILDYNSIERSESLNCSNEIRVPIGFLVALELDFVQFTDFGNFLITDVVANRTLLNATNNFDSMPMSILSTSNWIRIDTSTVRFLRMYYHSNVNTLPTGCGGHLTSLEGQFANPPYDSRDYSECTWRISIPAGVTLQFNFRSFDMGPNTNCDLDNIKFYEKLDDDTETLRHLFCGPTVIDSFKMQSDSIRIVAKKSPNFAGTGFRLYFNQLVE
ncbi:LOW QUALITY PROTEIN: cubilin homolog [Drosophila albomicans]|uniref:Cubilin n=1 Tax=Drosophila albomicans TaxID=7291 RepID=A0A6P8X272_DROAB|nr:LOW QUALITY PROTEIN: cubilin homolog [Drosophila albomicans]